MKELRRLFCLATLIPVLAACSDATEASQLSPSDVAGMYNLCALGFVPDNPTQPAVDIRARAFETTNSQVQSPRLALDVSPRTSAILFTRKGQFVPQELRGTYDLKGSQVVVKLPSSTGPSAYLLPESIPLDFQTTTAAALLTTDAVFYSVSRSDYARLADIPETGLAAQIPGRLSMRAQQKPCI